MTRYMTIDQVADALSVHANTIRRMLPQLGAIDLTGGKGGKRLIRIPETAVTAFLRERMILAPIKRKGGRPCGARSQKSSTV